MHNTIKGLPDDIRGAMSHCYEELDKVIGTNLRSSNGNSLFRLLDLDAMQSIEAKGSIFERTFAHAFENSAFLHILSETLTRPVMPDEEASEYLVTQAIADYLANRREPTLDGIIYPSAQQRGKLKRNVVLFHKSARVGDLGLPRHTKVRALHTTRRNPTNKVRIEGQTETASAKFATDCTGNAVLWPSIMGRCQPIYCGVN